MADDESVIREVEQELAADRQWAFFRQYGAALIGGAVAIVLGVAGWQIWEAQANARASNAAIAFDEAVERLAQNPDEGRAALASFAEEAPAGYAALASFRRAASFAQSGAREEALGAYRDVYNDADAPKRLRDLARLRAGYLSASDGRQAAAADLGGLIDRPTAFGAYAREIAALAALDAGDYADAEAMFERAAEDAATPEPVRMRAKEFAALAAAGAAGVNIKGDARVEDLLNALDSAQRSRAPENEGGEEAGDSGALEEAEDDDAHAGHAHGEDH